MTEQDLDKSIDGYCPEIQKQRTIYPYQKQEDVLDETKRLATQEGMIYEMATALCTEDNAKYNKYDWCSGVAPK